MSEEQRVYICEKPSYSVIFFMFFGAYLFGEGIYDYLFVPGSDIYEAPLWVKIMVTLVVLVFAGLGVLFSLVKNIVFSDDLIYINPGKKTIQIDWNEVESIQQLKFVLPPAYRMKLKNNKTYFFVTDQGSSFHFFGFTVDLSEFGQYVQEKKTEYGI
ncbi:hypothetical protein [Xanthocytophaga agilis]|uniref:Uncharacterized protein n=1 Tax=Xanthocytophaga agilis TaxID=3048010 RepID=A0AAE3R017_9BACT|nr:hypothetical protein [Xanthocytophaga agilis]MDJ1501186.1 hypothetical protein [Xanthocytophaga agilis]